jgi:hypothetical protein
MFALGSIPTDFESAESLPSYEGNVYRAASKIQRQQIHKETQRTRPRTRSKPSLHQFALGELNQIDK